MSKVAEFLSNFLTGEPARAIGYGGGVILYFVAKASGSIADVSLDEALIQAASFIAIVAAFVESIRHYVYSENTVDAIIEEVYEEVG